MAITCRRFVQFGFLLLVIFIGLKFCLFVASFEAGVIPDFERPPGVEAFLPISALVSLKYFIFTGVINNIHPSALVLFLIICFTALISKKGFCSWVCPFGLLSEYLGKLHFRLFKNRLGIPKWIDYLLRTLKYFLLGFFLYTIFLKMPVKSIEQFIYSPYNRFSDVKMLELFTGMSMTTVVALLVLLALSVFIRTFWCRYLCPYGALLGIVGLLSMGTIKRDSKHCTDCGRCEKKCPGQIEIRQKDEIHSPECSACLSCVDNCPEENAIGFSLFSGKVKVSPQVLAVVLIVIFIVGVSMAKISGHWRNDITKQDYLGRLAQPVRLPGNINADIDPEKLMRMMQLIKAQRATLNKPPEEKQ